MTVHGVTRYLLVGAHRKEHGQFDGVHFFQLHRVDVSAVAFDANVGPADPKVLERVAAMRRQMTHQETFIAFRYGATASTREEVRAKCADHETAWAATLERFDGMAEFTLKTATGAAPRRPTRSEVSSGREYLERLHASRSVALPDDFKSAVEEQLAPLAERGSWNHRADGGHEFSFLVRRDAMNRVRESGESLKKRFPHTPFLLSGPWPLEVFADG